MVQFRLWFSKMSLSYKSFRHCATLSENFLFHGNNFLTFSEEKAFLTLSWPGKFLFHPKIGCFNFKPQFLLNYSSPKNDLYSVRKRSIRAFKSIFKLLGWAAALAPDFAPKLCTRRVCLLFSMFQNILRPL